MVRRREEEKRLLLAVKNFSFSFVSLAFYAKLFIFFVVMLNGRCGTRIKFQEDFGGRTKSQSKRLFFRGYLWHNVSEEDREARERKREREEETKVKSVYYYVQQACFHCNEWVAGLDERRLNFHGE